jgi:hypothetical protein
MILGSTTHGIVTEKNGLGIFWGRMCLGEKCAQILGLVVFADPGAETRVKKGN